MDKSYLGTAVNGDRPMSIFNHPLKMGLHHGIIIAGYIIPYIITFVVLLVLVPIVLLIIIHKDKKNVETFHNKLKKDTFQANLVATTLFCFCGTIYIFALDMRSIAIENTHTLPRYFVPKRELYNITWSCNIMSLISDVVGMSFFIVGMTCFLYCKKEPAANDDRIRTCLMVITLGTIWCIGSTVLSLSFHFQDVLAAWTTTPFYGSKIALFLWYSDFCSL